MKISQSISYGILAAAFALFVELLIVSILGQEFGKISFDKITLILIIVISIEEIFKFTLIKKISENLNNKEIIISALFVGFGFSILEIIINLSSGTTQFEYLLGLLIIHPITAGFIGLTLTKKSHTFLYSILIAGSIHFFYNFLVVYTNEISFYFCFLYFIPFVIFLLREYKKTKT